MEDGRMGFVRVEEFELHLWSRADIVGRWELSKVINLKRLLPIDCKWNTMPFLLGSAEGIGVIFLNVKSEIFTIDLKSSRAAKVYEASCIGVVVPYLNFYFPGAANQCQALILFFPFGPVAPSNDPVSPLGR
ncbi:hypothetical protein EJB05_13938, partial [Eragrostis curvula]